MIWINSGIMILLHKMAKKRELFESIRNAIIKKPEVPSRCGDVLLPLLLEALNVSKEWWRLTRHFRGKCVTQCQKTRFEVKVLGLSAGQWMADKEKMDCFNVVRNESWPKCQWKIFLENGCHWKSEICHCKYDPCKLERAWMHSNGRVSKSYQREYLCKKFLDGFKERLEAVIFAKGSATIY